MKIQPVFLDKATIMTINGITYCSMDSLKLVKVMKYQPTE